jgi:hypothetical protein
MKSQSAVVPVPACCAPDTVSFQRCPYCQVTVLWYAALLFHCYWRHAILLPGEDVIRPLILKEFNE